MKRFSRILLAAALVLPVALPQARAEMPAAEARPLTSRQQYQSALHSTCWVVLKQGWGTGWVLDVNKRLIVTNEHVVHGHDSADVFFPVNENGKLVRDPQHYRQQVKPAKATVIDRDPVRDLALLQLDSIPATAKSAKLAATSPESGELLRAVGGLPQGSEGLWGNISGEVRGVLRRPNGTGQVIMMIETTMPINRGNSGGGVFNELGELAGVVKSAWFGGQVHNTSMLIDITEVHAWLKEALPLVDPKSATDFFTRGDRRLRAGRLDVALADLNEAVKLDPKLVSARVRRGTARVLKGDAAAGLADLDEALKLDPKSRDALMARGIARRETNKLDEALADFDKLIELDPASIPAFRERAVTHILAKKLDQAVIDLTRAIGVNSKDATLFADRALLHKAMKNFDLAAADWKSAIDLVPNNPHYHNELGIVRLTAKDLPAAAEAFAKAATLNPKDPVLWCNLGVALRLAGKHADAIKVYSEALALAPEGTKSFNAALAWFGRGISRRELKDYSTAIHDLSEAIRLNAKVADFWFERGLAHKLSGAASAAADDFREAVKLDKSFAQRVAAMNPMVGTWVYRGLINGVQAVLVARFNPDGTCESVQKFVGLNGATQTDTNAGTYTLEGEILTMVSQKTGKMIRKIHFEGTKCAVEFTEIGMTLIFERAE